MNQNSRELDILAVLVTNNSVASKVLFHTLRFRHFPNLPPLVAGVDTAVGSYSIGLQNCDDTEVASLFGRHPVCDPDCLHLWNAGGCTLTQLQKNWWAVFFRIWQNLETIRYFQLAENFSADTLLMPTEREGDRFVLAAA